MLNIGWRLSTSIYNRLDRYAPSNQLARNIPTLRPWSGLAMALAATIIYLAGLIVCVGVLRNEGPAWLNGLVLLLSWNTMKSGWVTVVEFTRATARAARSGEA